MSPLNTIDRTDAVIETQSLETQLELRRRQTATRPTPTRDEEWTGTYVIPTRIKRVRAPRRVRREALIALGTVLALLAGQMGSSIWGNVRLEKIRLQKNALEGRIRDANAANESLLSEVQRMEKPSSVMVWAQDQRMVSLDRFEKAVD